MTAPPVEIDAFSILRTVGEGGSAIIYEATHPTRPGRFAVKVPHLELSQSPGTRARLIQEIQAMARLSHPHIVSIVEWGETTDLGIWFAMPLIAGGPLTRLIRHLDARALIALIDQLLDALAYVHDRGVVHRDIKPANLLVTETDHGDLHLLLTDFGIATLAKPVGIAAAESRTRQRSGLMGTPAFMAPEQVRGDPDVGPAADLYAVGVLTYLLFQGRVPYSDRSYQRVARLHLTAPVPTFSATATHPIPPNLEPFMRRLLAKSPLERFPSASAARVALAEVDAAANPSEQHRTRANIRMALTETGDEPTQLEAATLVTPECGHCGASIDAGVSLCPACGSPLGDDEDREQPSCGSSATMRTVAALAVRLDERVDDGSFARILLAAGARVFRADSHYLIAVLGLDAAQGDELLQVADLALALSQSGGSQFGGCAIAAGPIEVSDGHPRGGPIAVAVDLAARARGEICVQADLAETLAGRFELQGELTARRLVGLKPKSADRTRIVGRDREAQLVLQTAKEVEDEHRCDWLTFVGPAGMGKTALIDFALARLRSERPHWLVMSARIAPADTAEPLAAIKAALRAWLSIGASAPAPTVIAALLRAAAGLDESLVADAGAVIGGARRIAPVASADADQIRAFDVLGQLFQQLSRMQPVLLTLDGLQWTDAASRAFLAYLSERLDRWPLMVVAATRVEPDDEPGQTVYPLEPLDESAAWALFADIAGAAEPPARTQRASLIRLAGGHPFHLTELGRLMRQMADTPASAAAMPKLALGQLLQARIDALGPAERAVLQVAATIGASFFVPLLVRAVAELGLATQVDLLLAELERRGIVETVPSPNLAGVHQVRFAHEMLREQVLGTIDEGESRRVHEVTARWLEKRAFELDGNGLVQLGDHWEACGDHARAAHWYFAAGRRAEATGGLKVADTLYSRAIARLDGLMERPVDRTVDVNTGSVLPVDLPALLVASARVALASGDFDRADRAAERALSIREPRRVLVHCEACRIRSDAIRSRRDYDRALRFLDQGLNVVGLHGDRIMRAQLLARRGFILGYLLDKNDEGRRVGHEALALLEGLDVPDIQAHIYSDLGANELRAGEWDRQLACNERALELSTEARDLFGQLRAHINVGLCYTNRGQLDRGAEHTEAAARLAARIGAQPGRIVALSNLAIVRLDQGRLEEAERLLTRCAKLCDHFKIQLLIPEARATLARVKLAGGDVESATQLAAEAIAEAEAQSNDEARALALRTEALVLLARGDRAGAIARVQRALDTFGDDADRYELAITELMSARLRGDDDSAEQLRLHQLGADVALELRRWPVDSHRPTTGPASAPTSRQ